MTALYAGISLVGILSCVVASIVWLDWQLGVLEAMAVIVSIGLSVDFIVHISIEYTHAPTTSRKQRILVSMLNMGPSVLSGALSTILSGVCLLPAQAKLYHKFGVLIIITIGFSCLWSLVFFTALLSQAGTRKGLRGTLGTSCAKFMLIFVRKFGQNF